MRLDFVLRKELILGAAATVLGLAVGLGSAVRAQSPLLTFKDLLARKPALADRRIAYGPDASQFGELWVPAHPRRAPVVVVIHGGCWRSDLPGLELMNGVAFDLRRRGYAVWNIEYRRLGSTGGGYPETFDDVSHAIDFLRVLSRTDHLDLGKVVLLGHSAGGHLALWAAARGRLPSGSPLRSPHPLHVTGVVSLAGIDDLAAYRDSGIDACGGPATIDALVGAASRKDQPVYADTSPADLLPIGVAQAVVSGEADPIVPARFGRDFAAKVKAGGDAVSEVTVPAAGHFELIDPSSAAWPTVVRAVRRLSRRGGSRGSDGRAAG